MEYTIKTLLFTAVNNIFTAIYVYIYRMHSFIITVNPVYIFYMLIILLILNILWIISAIKNKNKREKESSLKDFLKLLPLKICYWQENSRDFFVNEDVPILLKSSLYGYGIIQFILTYNQDIQENFAKLQVEHSGHFKILLTTLAVEVSIYKNVHSYFMLLTKIDKNQDSLLRAAINDMTGNITWIEAEGGICFRNTLGEKYKSILSTLQYQDKNRVLSIDNVLYKYNKYSNQSYTIHMLNEIEEFKNFHRDEKYKELIYSFLSFLKEKFIILNRSGKVVFVSEGLKSMIQLQINQQIYDIKDLFNIMSHALSLPDEINFNTHMDNMKNKILRCEVTESEYFTSLDGRTFSRTIFPKGPHVMLVFEDISKQIANEKEHMQNKTIQDVYWNNLNEGIIVFDSSGRLLCHNKALLYFIDEKFIEKKDYFNSNLQEQTNEAEDENNIKVYLSTSIDRNSKFTITENLQEEFVLYLLKPYKESVPNKNIEYLHSLLPEVENQWRYLDYVKAKEKDIKTIEQINFIFKSLHKVKIQALSTIDYYEEPKILGTQVIDLIEYIKNFLNLISVIYSGKNITLDNKISSYNTLTDKALLQRAMWYFFEFFYSFFLINNKTIKIIFNEHNKLIMLMRISQKFNYENLYNTRLVYVMQKLFKMLSYEVSLVDEDDGFVVMVTFI